MFGAGFAAPFAGLLRWGANLVETIGKKTNINFIKNHGQRNSDRIKKFTEQTFAEAMPQNRVTKIIAGGTNGVFNALGGAIEKTANVIGIKNPSVKTTAHEIRNFAQTAGKANSLNTLMNGSFIVGSAVSGAGVAKGFWQGLSAIQEMEKDISGKNISKFDVIFGKLSAPTAEAKSNLLKGSSLFGLTDAASLAVAVLSTVKNKVSPLAFFIPQLVSMAGGKMLSESIAPEYKAFKQAYASGQQISAEAYANFLGNASPALRERGGAGSPYTQKLAEKYAAQKESPQDIMKKISNGTLEKDIKVMIAEVEAAKKIAPVAAINAAHTAPQQQPTHSHVAALQGQRTAQPAQDVVGNHTKKIVEHAAQANNALKPIPAFGGA